MKNLSIKSQLTFWYTFIILVVSIVLFMSFYIVTQRSILIETDRSLYTHAADISENIGINTNNVFDDQTEEIVSVSKAQIPGIFLELTDINGHNVNETELNLLQELAVNAIKADAPTYSNVKIGDSDLRAIAHPIKNNSNTVGTVIMGHPVDVYTSALAQLRTTLIILSLFFIVPSIALGYLLAQNAVTPIIDLSKKISQITEENLVDRVSVPSKSLETFTLIKNFNNLLDRLKEAFVRERQFVGDVAHEIKTPLTVIKSNAEVTLAKKRTVEEYEKSLTQVLDHTNKLSKNLSGLIDYAWSQTTDVTKQFEQINLSKLLQEVYDDAQNLAQIKNINLSSEIVENVIVLGKKEKLVQVFINLVDNAVKFTPQKGAISINLATKNGFAIAQIKDNGIGIDKKDLDLIFNRFSRVKDNEYIQGHGLGLSIAYSIIKAHNGTIEVQSVKNNGTTFTVKFKLSS